MELLYTDYIVVPWNIQDLIDMAGENTIDRRDMTKRGDRIRYLKSIRKSGTEIKTAKCLVHV
jgi:hypothetical protein